MSKLNETPRHLCQLGWERQNSLGLHTDLTGGTPRSANPSSHHVLGGGCGLGASLVWCNLQHHRIGRCQIMEAADKRATFDEVQAVAQLVMRKLQNVVMRNDREAML